MLLFRDLIDLIDIKKLRQPHLSRKIDDLGTLGTIARPRLRKHPLLFAQIAPAGLR